jgi:hypothetical protein
MQRRLSPLVAVIVAVAIGFCRICPPGKGSLGGTGKVTYGKTMIAILHLKEHG